MRKPTAGLVIAAIAIPVFGGLATYAAATVSTKPAPQVVIPSPTADDHGGKRVAVTTPTTVDDHGGQRRAGSDDPINHDATDDKGTATPATSPPAATTPTTVDDHGGQRGAGSDDPMTPTTATTGTTPTTVDDHGGLRSTTTTGTTPTTVDDHGGSGSGRHGSDG